MKDIMSALNRLPENAKSKKSFIDSKDPMARKIVKMPTLGQPVKNNNCLFYSEEMLYEEPLLKKYIGTVRLWKNVIKRLTL